MIVDEEVVFMLKNKIAVVTGAASGIGLATAEELAKQGAKVILADINEELLPNAAKKTGGDVFVTDLSKRSECNRLANFTLEKYGRADILVNIAGLQNVSSIADFPEDKWDFMISLMLTAPFLLTKYFWNAMKERGWGRVINLNSVHGLVASEFKSAYCSAKHGLTGFSKVGAMEGGPYGITVNSICPAYVRTPLVDGQMKDQAAVHGITEKEVVEKIFLQKAAIKKLLEPATVAEVVTFLCSDAASSITGVALPIDGGWTAN